MSIFGKQAAATEALADFVAKVRNDDVDRHNEHATAIEQLLQGQTKIAKFADGLATRRRVVPTAVYGSGAIGQAARRFSADDLPVLRSATMS